MLCRLQVSEWLNLMAFLGTVDSKVHLVHISPVIAAYTLELLCKLQVDNLKGNKGPLMKEIYVE